MTSNIDRTTAPIQEPLLHDDSVSNEPRVDLTCEREGADAGTVGAAIGGSAVGAIAGTLIGGPIGTAIGATLGGVGGAMLKQASEGQGEPQAPEDGPGPFENPASYDETAAEVAKDRSILVGDDPGIDAVDRSLGTEERVQASQHPGDARVESIPADELH
jgi:hypothetical protein